MNEPSFIICGTQKGGTNALMNYIKQHPDVYMHPKEIDYFSWKYNKKSWKWYMNHFPDGKVCGEKSPSYMFKLDSAKRIYRHIPDVKLIFLLRNPIDRAYSQYWMNVVKGKEKRSFSDAIRNDEGFNGWGVHSYVSYGMYEKQLNYFYKYFKKSQMFIEKSENLKKNPHDVLKRLTKFLCLNPHEYNKHTIDFKKGTTPRSKLITRVLQFKPVRHIPVLYNRLASYNKSGESYPPMKKEDKEFLEEIYEKTKM